MIARPMPRVPPVTMAFLPLSESMPAFYRVAVARFSTELFRFERIVGRIGRISSRGFPATHLYSLMMQLPMKHALSKAHEEWVIEREAECSPKTVAATMMAQDAATPAMEGTYSPVYQAPGAGFWSWFVCIVAITLVDILEANYYETSSFVDLLQVLLFLSTFMIFVAFMIFNRHKWYRAIDVLINWTRDGRARKALLLRQGLMTLIICGGQFWGYLCAFNH